MNAPFLFVMLLTALVMLAIVSLTAEQLVHHHHAQKVDFFRICPIQPGDIVFLGDSLTDGARWDELFPGLPVKNRGINADLTTGVLNRLDQILSGKPKAIFILIGTNDLPWYAYRSDGAILRTYAKILARCSAESPETQVFVQSLLPRHPAYSARIRRLNAELNQLAERFGLEYIDLFPHFVGPDGGIDRTISNDRLHLLGAGYQRWVKILTPYIEKLNA